MRKKAKFGFDPTGKSIHLGRTIPLLKLREMQDDGWVVSLIIGDFTARIGDPSDKLGKRPELTHDEIEENIKKSLPLIFKILDESKTHVLRNSSWYTGEHAVPMSQLLTLVSHFSVQQMTQRRNFSQRMKAKEPIYMHELLYPILQGFDSYEIDADAEVGGEDQIFNMNIGRDIQELYKEKPQDVIVTPLLEGTDGDKMSTSKGNTINIDDDPRVMFDKVMSIRDDLAVKYAKLCTNMDIPEVIDDFREFKVRLANEIVGMYHEDWVYLNPEFKKKR